VSYNLPERPVLGDEERAAVAAAVEEVVRAQLVLPVDATPSWRFSGRWFNTARNVRGRPLRSS
jgi:hypothetical protein